MARQRRWVAAGVLGLSAATGAWGFPAGGPVGLAAQERAEVRLGAPIAVHPDDFGLVGSVRELSDGRVLVADPLGRILVSIAPDLGEATPLGREGEGPAEYRQPDAVWPLPGDSTLLVDLGNARITVLGPDGHFGRTRPLMLSPFEPGRGTLSMMLPRGVDAVGRVYFDGARQGPGGALLDSVPVLRFDPATERVDTLARVRAPEMSTASSGSSDNQQVRITPVPLSAADAWAVAPDGSVAVVRASDYRVEWVRDGQVTSVGPSPTPERIAIGRAEREEWADEQQRNAGIGVGVTVENGEVSVVTSRRSGQRPADLAALPWPDAKPLFDPASARVDETGRVWVRRSQPADVAPLYDVFDRNGSHLSAVRFPERRRLVGFGEGVLYAVAVGDFDLLTLERYALPELGG